MNSTLILTIFTSTYGNGVRKCSAEVCGSASRKFAEVCGSALVAVCGSVRKCAGVPLVPTVPNGPCRLGSTARFKGKSEIISRAARGKRVPVIISKEK